MYIFQKERQQEFYIGYVGKMTRHTRKRSTIAGKQCAPQRGKGGTCFTMHELRHIAKQFNSNLRSFEHSEHYQQTHKQGGAQDAPSSLDPIAVHQHRNKMDLWSEIDARMQATTGCATEMCWADQDAHTAPYTSTAFRPTMPQSWKANRTEWLSTTDIQSVMKQYEKAHTGFHFVGAVPVDFASPHDSGQMGKCVVQALCNVRISQWWKRGVRQIGIVYNLDAHDEPGSHWVSSFIDIDACKVYYYDSFGAEPPYEIHRFLNNVASQLSDFHDDQSCDVQTNTFRHQFKNTECGIYSMYFIATMLNGERSYEDFVQNGLNDTQMNAYRHTFYNTLDDYERGESISGENGLVGGGRRRKSRSRKRRRQKRQSCQPTKKP